jgi:hypothetical protein
MQLGLQSLLDINIMETMNPQPSLDLLLPRLQLFACSGDSFFFFTQHHLFACSGNSFSHPTASIVTCAFGKGIKS